MDNLVYSIWLSLSCTPDSPTFFKLLGSFDSAEEIYNATDREIRSCVGPNVSDCSSLSDKSLERAEKIYEFCTSKGVGIVTYWDDGFPLPLRDIPTPPVLLYYRGTLPSFERGFRCAIVGTRHLSDYGRKNAFYLGYDMACAGAVVVSGMAIGIDGVALAGALSAGGKTIAVLGSGIDVCYPSIHLKLAREIVKNGCIFTEYPPGTKPERYNFPRRNRLISGLSTVTVVVEGKETSGSLLTARHAKAQNRPVYAFPGNVYNEGSQVTNLLLKNGARVCTAADDIARDYENECPRVLCPERLQVKRTVNMDAALREYQVGCVTPTDDIFIPARPKPGIKIAEHTHQKSDTVVNTSIVQENTEQVPSAEAFDKEALLLYKKIPSDTDCPIESLVDSSTDLKKVMRLLLKLEMGRFIRMLPGDRVSRNIK